MRLVIDASIAVKWGVSEKDTELAARLLESDHELLAPELLGVEVANALWSNWRKGIIDAEQMDALLARIPGLIQIFVPDSRLIGDAAVLSRLLHHPVYDCVYLDLARQAGATVVTVDERFTDAARAAGWESYFVRPDAIP